MTDVVATKSPEKGRGSAPVFWTGKFLVTFGVAVCLWLILTVLFWCLGCQPLETKGLKGWLELFNGATWPENWCGNCMAHPGAFAASLSARTLLNAAAPVAVFGAGLYTFFSVRELERVMLMNKTEMLRVLGAEVVTAVITVLRIRDLSISEDLLKEVSDAGQEAVDNYLKDLERLAAANSDKARRTS